MRIIENIETLEPKNMYYSYFPTGDNYLIWSVGYTCLCVVDDDIYIMKNINTGEVFKTTQESYDKLIKKAKIKDTQWF